MGLVNKVAFLGFITLTQAVLIKYEFNITSATLNPDCHTEGYESALVNGQFPAPTIYATQGDEIEILVRNNLKHTNTSIHYHGIRQIGSTESDGVPGVTQHPIQPGTSLLQKFKIDGQAGTYFYHAHVGMQDDSVQGPFIVYESDKANPATYKKKNKSASLLEAGPYKYKKDLILQLSEWWHDGLKNREDYYMSPAFTFDHGSESVLLNGRTVFDPATSSPNCPGYTTFDVEPNTTYRLRFIGANTFRTFAAAVKNHNLTLIEVDGELIHPYTSSFVEISPGQRYSALLKTGDYPSGTTFAIGTSYLWRQRSGGVTENGFGYIRYQSKNSTDAEENSTQLFKPVLRWGDKSAAFNKRQTSSGDGNKSEHKQNTNNDTAVEDETKNSEIDSKTAEKDQTGQNANKQDEGKSQEGGSSGQGGGRGGRGGRGGPKKEKKVYKDLPTFPNVDQPDWVLHEMVPLAKRNPILDKMDVRTIKLAASIATMLDNSSRYLVNDRMMPIRHTPALLRSVSMFSNMTSADAASVPIRYNQDYNEALGTYRISHNEVVDLVFQNVKNRVGGCLLHPWHTHGHSHYVIASGPDDYEHSRDKDIRNFKNPLYRDTTIAYPSVPNKDSSGCGWTKVRLLADNPGFWAVHCHITTHMLQGKMIVLEEAPELIKSHSRYHRY